MLRPWVTSVTTDCSSRSVPAHAGTASGTITVVGLAGRLPASIAAFVAGTPRHCRLLVGDSCGWRVKRCEGQGVTLDHRREGQGLVRQPLNACVASVRFGILRGLRKRKAGAASAVPGMIVHQSRIVIIARVIRSA